MKEYIEREAVIERLAKVDMDTYYGFTAAVQFGVNHAIQCIKEAPAADVAPVRHGRWIVFDSENPESKECTACGYLFSRIHPSNYCPYCGALMDGKEGDHD